MKLLCRIVSAMLKFGFFTRKLTSGTCISTTKDPACNENYSEMNSLNYLDVLWSSVFKSQAASFTRKLHPEGESFVFVFFCFLFFVVTLN